MRRISKELKLYGYLGFLAIVLSYVIAQLYVKSHLPELGWTISDWLINYEDGGFKRRGLAGSIFFFIQDSLKIPLNTQVFIIQTLFFLLIFYCFARLLLSKKLNWDILILLCSPLCLLFIPVNIFNSGRKEIILMALLVFYVNGKPDRFKNGLLFTGYIIGLFLHELFYFYLPFVMAAYMIKAKKTDLQYIVSLFAASTLVVFVLFFCGGELNQGQSLEFLQQRGVQFNKWNIFTYDAVRERKDMLDAYPSYMLFASELLLMIWLFFLFVKKYLPQKVNTFKAFIVISLVWVSPLYFLGADWFRWNHIYSLLLIILIISSLPDNESKTPYIEGKMNLPLLLLNVFFFIVFFLHIQYDTSGNSIKSVIQYIKGKTPF
ncbi:hypothetical protein [Chryseobacterium daecheongense]|uniref:EpsG family protein n=1 Tax=Chryseobacterium daecheongense TaxID=192389 RepID=A0A3N0VYZ4_9FLAO|nr:hypothetical protein [Chryseobacterium daecheongense]ROH97740.1 hypothetical protein EGI05_10225 [Chryseobacterium daecheongense]TDX93099.1 hypothetical protein BCF50_2051 [Chryseobacterium daecheongense]